MISLIKILGKTIRSSTRDAPRLRRGGRLTMTTKDPMAKGQFFKPKLAFWALLAFEKGVVSDTPNCTPRSKYDMIERQKNNGSRKKMNLEFVESWHYVHSRS